jgi:hypothetical protein
MEWQLEHIHHSAVKRKPNRLFQSDFSTVCDLVLLLNFQYTLIFLVVIQ